jgi:hypothetical protein
LASTPQAWSSCDCSISALIRLARARLASDKFAVNRSAS